MSERRHPDVVNVSEVEPVPGPTHGKRFGCADRRLGAAVGGKLLGCSHYVVEPGKTSFPFHHHTANEEAIFILAGTGTLRIGGERVEVRAEDYIALPPGPDHAHQLINTGDAPLTYICFSTMNPIEIVGYPDSDKIGVRDSFTPRKLYFTKDGHDQYFAGEPED
jgi:uncharacterized cupin superfamily protein